MPISTFVAVPSLSVGDKITATRWGTIVTALNFFLGPPEANATNIVGTSIPNNAETVVPMASETVDTGALWDGAMHDNVTNNSRITITTAGRYDIDGVLPFASNATGRRVANLRKNAAGVAGGGVLLRADAWAATPTAADFCYLFVRSTETLAVNDHIEMFAFQTSGGALALSTAAGACYLRARLVGQ